MNLWLLFSRFRVRDVRWERKGGFEQCTALIEAPCAAKSPRTRAVGASLKHRQLISTDFSGENEDETGERREKVGPERRLPKPVAADSCSSKRLVKCPRRLPVRLISSCLPRCATISVKAARKTRCSLAVARWCTRELVESEWGTPVRYREYTINVAARPLTQTHSTVI